MTLKPLAGPIVAVAAALVSVGALVVSRVPASSPIVAVDAGLSRETSESRLSKWAPARASWTPGDLHDRACRHAKELGCDVGDLGGCASGLAARGHDALWDMRMMTVVQAQTRQHVADSTVLPCDAGRE